MAEGLQYKENLTLISGGYPGENPGSNGVVQDWTETTGYSGSSTVTYHYNDSAQMTNANSTYIEINITDNWTATRDNRNYYHITVSTTINYIRRTRVGSPSPLSVYMFARHDAGGANIWTSGGCVDAANSGTNATNINMGTTTIDLAPGQSTNVHGTVYFRSNICGHNNAKPPSIYVDEFWLGVNFRNTLPPDYRPGKTWNGVEWISHNREAGSYVGKNKFKVVGTSSNGIITTNLNEKLAVSGQASDNWCFASSETPQILDAGDYTLSIQEVLPHSVDIRLFFTDNTNATYAVGAGGTVTHFSTSKQINKYVLLFGGLTVGQTYNETIEVQLEKGAEATEWVPYKQYFSAGATDIYTSATSKNTMRTQDGGVGTNNPPYTRHNDNTWRNQRKVGVE